MKYPNEIVSYFSSSKTLSVEANFTLRHETDEAPLDKPLEIFDDNFSRFSFAAISNGKAATCNVSIGDLPAMRAATDYAMRRSLERQYSPTLTGEMPKRPAYTVKFRMGELKGKSPAEVLYQLGSEKGKEALNKEYSFLKKNIDKFPDNKKIMDAIVDASKLTDEDLNETNVQTATPVDILNIAYRPLTRKTREDGMCFCYGVRITWNDEQDNPVQIRVSNYYAPFKTKEDGTLNVFPSQRDKNTEYNVDIYMSAASWLETIRKMESARDGFEIINYQKMFKLADEASKKNRQEARNEK